ncbi:MAG: protein-glutamate O-methyltransferase CheR [Lachnospiraceae bacterium]|nr:protein-glutamate O-methyltransferase CheR [Lachnospiraceae bacterium]
MDYEQFKEQVLALTKINLHMYKEKQMKRRIDSLIAKNKIDGYKAYIEAIKKDTKLFEEFVNYLTINVSEFWRNPDQWKVLEEFVVPELISKFGKNLKIWSAACSTGDEPYSLVMLLSKFMPLSNIKILATDIDKQVLEKARVGLYNEKSLVGLPEEFKKKYFTPVGKTNYQISEEIKRCVEFKEGNLLADKYPSGLDLIVCRNVVIYFTDEAKSEIYKKFNQSLKSGAYLFVGSTEQIINYKDLNYSSFKSFFYKKN